MSKLHEQRARLAAELKALAATDWDDQTRAEIDERQAAIERLDADIERAAAIERSATEILFAAGALGKATQMVASNELTFGEFTRALALGEHDVIRAVTETGTAELPGALPEHLWGPMRTFVGARTPIWESFFEMPTPESGLTITRTYDPTNNAASFRATEFSDWTSAALSVERKVTEELQAVGHVRRLSYAAIQRSQMDVMALAQIDLQRGLVRRKELFAASRLVAAATTSQTLSLTATPAQIEVALLKAATTIEDSFNAQADRVYMASDRLEYLKGLADTTGRPIYPSIGVTNANASTAGIFGGIDLGADVKVVVSSKFPTGFFAVAASDALEKYNAPLAQLSTTNAVNASVDVSLSEFITTIMWSEGIVSLEP